VKNSRYSKKNGEERGEKQPGPIGITVAQK